MSGKKDPPQGRTLGDDIPELKEFLKPGMKVLDVGCGPGTITLEVAAAVKPGEVLGLDVVPHHVKAARELQASSNVDNCSYQVGDSHKLDFPDDTFDLVYSHTVIHFFLDPVGALKEQKRVTKPGGWVIASGVRIMLPSLRYPPCPNWGKVWEAGFRLAELRQQAFHSSGLGPVEYAARQRELNPTYNVGGVPQAGRRVPGWFSEAGLQDLKVQIRAERIQYHGSEIMEPNVWDLIVLADAEDSWDEQITKNNQEKISEGFLDEETLRKAKDEVRAWYKAPDAFYFNILVFAAGRA